VGLLAGRLRRSSPVEPAAVPLVDDTGPVTEEAGPAGSGAEPLAPLAV
jgi:hypothetical protein